MNLSQPFLERALALGDLERIVASMRKAAEAAGVLLVTGDTKVVDRGKADGCFVTTTGLGLVTHTRTISADRARPGDVVILSGPIGEHGMAIMAARADLELETPVASDTPIVNSTAESARYHESCGAINRNFFFGAFVLSSSSFSLHSLS